VDGVIPWALGDGCQIVQVPGIGGLVEVDQGSGLIFKPTKIKLGPIKPAPPVAKIEECIGPERTVCIICTYCGGDVGGP
jgi:hypothetical protein